MLRLYLDYGKVTMPDAFGHLIHLRSLKIINALQQFPRSLCKLYHLQVLNFSNRKGTIELPESMNRLVNLRHMSENLVVTGVGKLISLQELYFFIRKERGYKIGELGDLIWLRTLGVRGLESVDSQKEASMAKLSNKRNLQTLHLEWTSNSDPGMDKQELILDRLQPHANLKELSIKGYLGIRYANWMGFELINNLRNIYLSNCLRLDHVPPLGRLHFLEVFEMNNMPKIKKLDYQCQHVKCLFINNMEGLEELSGPAADAGQWHPHLHNLRISNCPKLEFLPSLSLSIREIHLHNLGLVSLPTLWLDRSSSCSTSGSLSSLKIFAIKNCGKITSLGQGLLQLQHYLTALTRLQIRNCAELVDFPSGGLQHLRALKYLWIRNCPKLQVALDPDGNDDKFLPWSLQSLHIEGCAALVRSMPIILKGIVSLGKLVLSDCEELMSLEGLTGLQTIESLIIDEPLLLDSGVLLRNIRSVRELSINKCGQLESIDGQLEQWFLQNQATLERIDIHGASSLKSLPGCFKNLSSLQFLRINGANKTLEERCRKDEGADWPTICHIPKVIL